MHYNNFWELTSRLENLIAQLLFQCFQWTQHCCEKQSVKNPESWRNFLKLYRTNRGTSTGFHIEEIDNSSCFHDSHKYRKFVRLDNECHYPSKIYNYCGLKWSLHYCDQWAQSMFEAWCKNEPSPGAQKCKNVDQRGYRGKTIERNNLSLRRGTALNSICLASLQDFPGSQHRESMLTVQQCALKLLEIQAQETAAGLTFLYVTGSRLCSCNCRGSYYIIQLKRGKRFLILNYCFFCRKRRDRKSWTQLFQKAGQRARHNNWLRERLSP